MSAREDTIDTIEARTPGWHWLGYRTWRCAGNCLDSNGGSATLGHTYQVIGRRRWRGQPHAALAGAFL